ncbi:RagB/SusD family nutrient uptake outer membrane protein [Sphingobacterium yanglingense]|uniref:SusD-like starch-binding protein associating with outer membrane n=1 Tax=Sphingobacterium yanglingense TaxID=1437280 RepID=A0A4R6WKA4_9SPHI|nr:RagB/SusD family nutrient uptake outer membrane protein [Sphingobacterium yanglingense]TDQ79198.1 SusD-like starch-binding protein associating with outer membrane [Sphingobacterium yanglingense]
MLRSRLIYILLFFILMSCKDYLDIKSNSGLATPDNFEAMQRILDNMEVMNISTNPLGEASSDNYFLTLQSYNSLGMRSQEAYTWRIIDNNFPNDWATSYLTVYHSNIVLDNLKSIQINDANKETWSQLAGAAYFYRSYAYLSLLWTYAKGYEESEKDLYPGIVLRVDADPYKPSERSSIAACYNTVIHDLERSIPLLPRQSEHVLRPSKAAAYGLLARTYLSMGHYIKSEIYADSAWMISAKLIDYNMLDANTQFPFERYNIETTFFSQMSTTLPGMNYYNALVDTTLYKSYNKDDLRLKLFFAQGSDGYYQFKGSYAGASDFFTGITSAEILLMRAESYIRNGRIERGLSDLNHLMRHRYATGKYKDLEGLSQEDALESVLCERRKELLFRGLRWMDVKRLNLEGRNIVLKRQILEGVLELVPNSNRYALPIPTDVVDRTGIPQNPQ